MRGVVAANIIKESPICPEGLVFKLKSMDRMEGLS
jgi:hypothetical protein